MKQKWILPGTIAVISAIGLAMWFSMPDDSLVGEWKIVGSGFGDGVEAFIEFNEDGTFSQVSGGSSVDVPLAPDDLEPVTFETMIVGTWDLEGDKLSMVFNDQGIKINGQRIVRKTIQQGIEKQNILGALNSYSPFELKWNGPDEFTTMSKDQTRRYTRVSKE